MITNLFVVTIEFHYHTNKKIEFGVISLSSHSLYIHINEYAVMKVEHIKYIFDNNRYNNLKMTSCIKNIQ